MNAQIIMQIVKESEEISDSQLSFGSLYTKRSNSNNPELGEHVSYGPIGHHVLKHPEIGKLLGAKIKSEEYPYAPTVSEMMKSDKKSFTTKQEWLTLDGSKLEKYLGLGYEHVECLFYNSRFTKEQFVDTVTAFVRGEIDIRKCHRDGCEIIYTFFPDDKACVCDTCKEDMLDMCGM